MNGQLAWHYQYSINNFFLLSFVADIKVGNKKVLDEIAVFDFGVVCHFVEKLGLYYYRGPLLGCLWWWFLSVWPETDHTWYQSSSFFKPPVCLSPVIFGMPGYGLYFDKVCEDYVTEGVTLPTTLPQQLFNFKSSPTMTTPAEPIPVAQAIHVSSAVTSRPTSTPSAAITPAAYSYFQPLSFAQFLRRTIDVYLGHFDTFLTLTVVVSLPAILGYQWMRQGYWGSSYLFHYLLLPLTRLVADGAAVTATALIYLQQGQPISWKAPLQRAWHTRRLPSLWLLQVLRGSLLGRWVLVPTGMMAFATPLLLLQVRPSLIGSLFTSARLVCMHSIGTLLTTIVVTYGVTPFLSWILRRLVGDLVVRNNDETIVLKTEGDDEIIIMSDDDSLYFFSQRRQVQEVIALPLISCMWTILYLNICIRKRRGGMTRETLAAEMGIPLPPTWSTAHIYY
jgi:hypothetical protein